MTYRKDYKTKNVSLYPYKEATITPAMYVVGSIVIILLFIIAYMATYIPPMA